MYLKKLLLASALLLAGSTAHYVTARPLDTPPSATAMTRAMSERLQLNEGQYIKLLSINRIWISRQQEIAKTTAADQAARTSQLAELQMQYEQECARLLTPTQLSHLQQDHAPAATAGTGQG